MKEKIVYLVSSPFQFYGTILDFYENRDRFDGYIYYFRYVNDNKNKYEEVVKKLNLENLNYYELNVNFAGFLRDEKISAFKKITNKFDKINYIISHFKKIKKDVSYADIVKLGDRHDVEGTAIAKFLKAKELVYLGDGASLVFEKNSIQPLGTLRSLFYKIFQLKVPEKILENREDFFKNNWQMIQDYYSALPIKDEIWVFGQSGYFVKPSSTYNYSDFAKEAIKEDKVFNFNHYFDVMKKIKSKYSNSKVLYFPHRNEPVLQEHLELFEISEFKHFSEILPFMVGYLPKTIIASSTTIFSFCNINQHLTNKVEVLYFSVSTMVDDVYASFGAKNLDKKLGM